jgi:hypothetical protein
VLSEVADMGGWPKCRGFDLIPRKKKLPIPGGRVLSMNKVGRRDSTPVRGVPYEPVVLLGVSTET